MARALELAKEADQKGEVPVGALLVSENQIVAEGFNQVELTQSVSAHAEMLVLKEAAKKLANWRLEGCILYSTLEPCVMCASAIRMSRVSKVVYGAPDIRLGGFGSLVDLSPMTVFGKPPEVLSGVFAEESAELLKAFFRARRNEEES